MHANRQADKHTGMQAGQYACMCVICFGMHACKQTSRQADKQTSRQAYRHVAVFLSVWHVLWCGLMVSS